MVPGLKNKTMKKIKIRLLISFLVIVLVYLSTAFIVAEINPFEWSKDLRGRLVFMSAAGIAVSNAVLGLPDIS